MKKNEIHPDRYYSRRLFGRYLNWVYQYLIQLAPKHIHIRHIPVFIESVAKSETHGWHVHDTENTHYYADYLFLTTGHTKRQDDLCWLMNKNTSDCSRQNVIHDPYPIKETLLGIGHNDTVAIEGLGLTTFDILSELTMGRGGKFINAGAGLVYQPSGQEPKILAYSRSGLPLTARAVNQKGVNGQYKARFLTLYRIKKLRENGKIDFQTDVLPLLINDMEYVYYETLLRVKHDQITSMMFCNNFVFSTTKKEREHLIETIIPEEERFNLESLINQIPNDALESRITFNNWLRKYLETDLHAANIGNVDSPIKAACDVIRDLRDNLRAAIDFGGLTETSHRWLYSSFVPVMNRIAVGPPKERIEEMLALIDAGILEIDWGPGAKCINNDQDNALFMSSRQWENEGRKVDILIKARVSIHSPIEDASPLTQNILKNGYARLFHNDGFHPGGIEVDSKFNLINQQGETLDTIWALGMLTEGAKFYTFVVPRPGVNSTAIVDAGKCVGAMFSRIKSTFSSCDTFMKSL